MRRQTLAIFQHVGCILGWAASPNPGYADWVAMVLYRRIPISRSVFKDLPLWYPVILFYPSKKLLLWRCRRSIRKGIKSKICCQILTEINSVDFYYEIETLRLVEMQKRYPSKWYHYNFDACLSHLIINKERHLLCDFFSTYQVSGKSLQEFCPLPHLWCSKRKEHDEGRIASPRESEIVADRQREQNDCLCSCGPEWACLWPDFSPATSSLSVSNGKPLRVVVSSHFRERAVSDFH